MRGQAHTLEAITASLLLISGLVFALQATAVTPLSASTSSQHLQAQHQAASEGALAATLREDAVRWAVLNWNDSGMKFYGAPINNSFYTNQAPTNEFGGILSRTFSPRNIAFNIDVVYETPGEKRKRQPMVYRGAPSDTAVSASVSVTLYDDDPFLDDDQARVTITNETHTYDGATTYKVADAPIVPNSTHDVHDASGDQYTRGVDYTIIDADNDGKFDTIKWIGTTPDSGETFSLDYTPAISGDDFYAPDVADGAVYNVVTVEVVAWNQ